MFQLILPLEQQALVKLADVLWNEESMDRILTQCRRLYYDENPSCQAVTHEVEEIVEVVCKMLIVKVPNTFLPSALREKLLCVIKKIGLQKLNWYFYHKKFWSIKKLPRIFYWTSRGTIDRKKTSEILVMDNTIDVCERYSLACCYCFEKEICKLSKEIPHRLKKLLTDYAFGSYTTFKDGRIVKYWNLILECEKLKNDQRNETNSSDVHQVVRRDHYLQAIAIKQKKIYRRAYKYALETANDVAADYFWRKLVVIEHGHVASLHRLLDEKMGICANLPNDDWEVFRPKEYYVDTAFFLLRQMTKKQQTKAFRLNPVETIQLFLTWPFQSLFSQSIENFFLRMSVDNSVLVLDTILSSKDRHIYKVFNHHDLYTEYWHGFSLCRKRSIINCLLRNSYLFSTLVIHEHYEVLRLLNNLTSAQKEHFLRSKNGVRICEEIADGDVWNSLKLFFEAALSSMPRVVVTKFKKKLKYFLAKRRIVNISKVFDVLTECEKSNFKG